MRRMLSCLLRLRQLRPSTGLARRERRDPPDERPAPTATTGTMAPLPKAMLRAWAPGAPTPGGPHAAVSPALPLPPVAAPPGRPPARRLDNRRSLARFNAPVDDGQGRKGLFHGTTQAVVVMCGSRTGCRRPPPFFVVALAVQLYPGTARDTPRARPGTKRLGGRQWLPEK